MSAAPVRRVYSKNADFQRFVVLKTNRNKRHRHGAFLVEGVRNINGALRYGWAVQSLLYAGGRALSRWAQDMLAHTAAAVNYELDASLMDELCTRDEPGELLAIVRMAENDPARLRLGDCPLLALFDRPGNKGNLGTIIRSCDALGVGGLIVTGHGVDPYDPEVVAATMGSLFSLPVVYMPRHADIIALIEEMKHRYPGFQAVGTSAHAEQPISRLDLTRPVLFMIGSETDGLSPALSALCDAIAAVPMAADAYASSLNVACAASIMFHEAVSQRAKPSPPSN
jgi:tRNA G18 (ribose-2'-O)-methylase SpoU